MALDETRVREIVRSMLRDELKDFQIHPVSLLPVRQNGDLASVGDSLKVTADGEVAFEA